MNVFLRRVQMGDESALAYIQTESWKRAFQHILDKETLDRCTNIDRAVNMYRRLLEEQKGNGYILFLDGQPHCIAWWDAARDSEFSGKAELICIHSLPSNWRKGYGHTMMEQVISDIKVAGFSEVVLWVFSGNTRARMFYEAEGFCATKYVKQSLGVQELCYSKNLFCAPTILLREVS